MEDRLTPVREVKRVVTYHDPCYLGRHNGIYEAPRRVLRSIPGLKLVEMTHDKEDSSCCGGGGGGAWRDEALNRGLGVTRVQEALNTGAEVIATACPFCIRMLTSAVQQLGVQNQIVVWDLAELLWQSMEIRVQENMIQRVDSGFAQEVCHV
jgi:Fe-S oxidoreductase